MTSSTPTRGANCAGIAGPSGRRGNSLRRHADSPCRARLDSPYRDGYRRRLWHDGSHRGGTSAHIRVQEASKAAAMIGATYHCLDERDGLVVYDKPTVQKTIDLLRRVAPTLVFTHAPKDYMLDHEQVSLLARAASFVYGAPNISAFPLLPGSGIPHLYYCDPIEGIDPLGHDVPPTTFVDISRPIDTKSRDARLSCIPARVAGSRIMGWTSTSRR